ncbi:MAG: CBS domain-containing protein [Candidatus Altiarchaeota archaeon]|nr:CBS domain-containing protein [Candidatus Altiarchaeota archaeon]
MVLVQDVMTADPECIHASDLVTKARSIMRRHRRRSLPVVEEDKLVGIITRGDVMRVTSNKANLLVGGIMVKNVVTSGLEEDLLSCAQKMIKAGIRQLPVVADDRIVGIISARDLLAAFMKHSHNPVKKKIADVMTSEVVFCEPGDEISGIWDKMYASNFSGFPVLKKKKVIGVLTRMDMIRAGSVRLSKESGRPKIVHVEKAMRTPAVTIKPGADVKEAAALMLERDIIRLPVTDEKGHLQGIVDIEDILRAYVG